MGSVTEIAWTDATFNGWIGCSKVSPGCTNCYAEARDIRFHDGAHWGKGAPRQRTSPSNWKLPLRWNLEAEMLGVRKRVFCASLSDVFDAEVPGEWRSDLWNLIAACPHLDWQLLTKRPENMARMLPWLTYDEKAPTIIGKPWPNVWLGTTTEDQERADLRIPQLLQVPAAKRFLSVEPQLGPVDLTRFLACPICRGSGIAYEEHGFGASEALGCPCTGEKPLSWVIVGGESGHGARPFRIDWARSIVEQCKAAGVAVFCKQMGSNPAKEIGETLYQVHYAHHKGGDPAEWPEDLRVREFPR